MIKNSNADKVLSRYGDETILLQHFSEHGTLIVREDSDVSALVKERINYPVILRVHNLKLSNNSKNVYAFVTYTKVESNGKAGPRTGWIALNSNNYDLAIMI